jgi:hypothetical protein
VLTTDYVEAGTRVTALVHPQLVESLKQFEVVHAS